MAKNGNGNEELAPLIELKRKYRQDCTTLEADIQARLGEELDAKKREVTQEYVEKIANLLAERLKPLLKEVLSD